LEYHHHLESDRDNLASILYLLEANGFGYQIRASGPAWPSEGVFGMLIYSYRKDNKQATTMEFNETSDQLSATAG
jgi:hypothetical protein